MDRMPQAELQLRINPLKVTVRCFGSRGRRQWPGRIENRFVSRPTLEAGLPLKLSLKPGERFVLNGAVVQNGDRRAVMVLQNKASVLREKDIMQAEQANTPARRIYFPVMMMYLDEAGAQNYYEEFMLRITEF